MLVAARKPPQPLAPLSGDLRPSLAIAQRWCRDFARRHAENFTVASWLLPRHLHQHFANVYAWCRWADDLADEHADAENNLQALADWELQLHHCAAGEAVHPIHVALSETLREFDLPLTPFTDLLDAFRQDQRQARYETFDELLGYCRRSANPVGHIVLGLGRCASAENIVLSDRICTGLQLVNFWQDVRRDWTERRRVYLPRETMRQFSVQEQDIAGGVANGAMRAAIAHEVERAESFLRSGWPLVARVSPELRIEVELFIRGGLAVAAAIRRQQYDVLARRAVVSRAQKFQLLAITALRQKVLRRYGAPA